MQKAQKTQKDEQALEPYVPNPSVSRMLDPQQAAERIREAMSAMNALRAVRNVSFDSERQDVFIAGIMAGLTQTEAALAAGVAPGTPYRLMRENLEFRERYEDAQMVRASYIEARLMDWIEGRELPEMAQVTAAKVALAGIHPDHKIPRQRDPGASRAELRRLPDGSMSLTVQGGDFMRQ